MIPDFTHRTRIVSRVGAFNLEEAVKELLGEGLLPGAKNITIFIYFDGFKIVLLPGQELLVEVDGVNYPLVILPTDHNIIHRSGDVQIMYDT